MNEYITNATDESFETDVTGEVPVLVDYWAEWCGPCRMIAPIIDDVAEEMKDLDAKGIRDLAEHLKDKLNRSVIMLAHINEDQSIHVVVAVSADSVKQYSAGELVKIIAEKLGGKGGGRSDLAQGGGNKPEQLSSAFEAAIKTMLPNPDIEMHLSN